MSFSPDAARGYAVFQLRYMPRRRPAPQARRRRALVVTSSAVAERDFLAGHRPCYLALDQGEPHGRDPDALDDARGILRVAARSGRALRTHRRRSRAVAG